MNIDSLTGLLAGLYTHYSEVRVEAIPSSLYYELAEKLAAYLPFWDYDKCSLEDWIKTMLLILPKVMIPESDLEYMKANNQIYIERWEGNVVLICSAPVILKEGVNND